MWIERCKFDCNIYWPAETYYIHDIDFFHGEIVVRGGLLFKGEDFELNMTSLSPTYLQRAVYNYLVQPEYADIDIIEYIGRMFGEEYLDKVNKDGSHELDKI